MMQIQKQTHEGAGKPELPKGIGNREVARRMQDAARKHSAGDWPQGYDLTSFLHGDDPQAQHSPKDDKLKLRGNINDLLDERDQYKASSEKNAASAEKLAEALRDLRSRVVAERPDCLNTTKADLALAEYDLSRGEALREGSK